MTVKATTSEQPALYEILSAAVALAEGKDPTGIGHLAFEPMAERMAEVLRCSPMKPTIKKLTRHQLVIALLYGDICLPKDTADPAVLLTAEETAILNQMPDWVFPIWFRYGICLRDGMPDAQAKVPFEQEISAARIRLGKMGRAQP